MNKVFTNEEAFEYLKDTLIKNVYLRAIEDWEKILEGKMKTPSSIQIAEKLSEFDSEQVHSLKDIIPEIVKTTMHFFLWNIDDGYLNLSLPTETSKPIYLKEISSGLAGDFSGWIDDLEETNKNS